MAEIVEQTKAAPADELKKKPKSDPYITGLFFFLLIVSVVESFSASSREISDAGSIYMPFIKHCIFLGGATIAMFAVQRIHYSKLVFPSLIFGVVTFFIMVYILFSEEQSTVRNEPSSSGQSPYSQWKWQNCR